jgi:hypothetical protein
MVTVVRGLILDSGLDLGLELGQVPLAQGLWGEIFCD